MPARSRRSRRDIEGMRAVAILAVVLYHAGAVRGGYVGVDVFFVVSGFLITGLLWREISEHGRVRFGQFYARRARRLLPASALVLVVTLIASAVIVSPLRLLGITKDAQAAALYVANYRFAAQRTSYLAASAPPSPVQHYWSLGVEEQFYLLWPLLVCGVAWMFRRMHDAEVGVFVVLGGIGAASLALSVHWTYVDQPWAFFSLPTRAWELALGGLIALAVPLARRIPGTAAALVGWAGLVAIVWSVVAFTDRTPFPGMAATIPALGTAAVVVAGTAATRLGPGRVLQQRPLEAIGGLSYSWYLWHWPVLVLVAAWVGHRLNVAEGLAWSAVSLVLAALAFALVERPIHFAHVFSRRAQPALLLGAGCMALVLVSVVVTATSVPPLHGGGRARVATKLVAATSPHRAVVAHTPVTSDESPIAAEAASAIARGVDTRAVPSNLDPSLVDASADKAPVFVDGCNDSYTDTSVRTCAFGDTQSPRTVMLVGDSHAAQWFPALDAIANERGWRLVALSKATCPPLELTVFSPVLGREFSECDRWRVAVRARIRVEKPFLVVLGVARHYSDVYHFNVYGPEWVNGMRAFVQELRADAPAVVVLGPTPKPDQDIPNCLAQHLTSAAACVQSRASAVDATGAGAEQAAVVAAGGRYLAVAPMLCTATQCPVIVGNMLVYRDDNHLTTTVTTWVAPLLASDLDAALRPVSSVH